MLVDIRWIVVIFGLFVGILFTYGRIQFMKGFKDGGYFVLKQWKDHVDGEGDKHA